VYGEVKCRGRPNLGKAATLKKRSIYIYLPTEEMVGSWKAEAERHGMSVSRFVAEVVDDSMRSNPAGLTPREELERDLRAAREQLATLKARLDSTESVLLQAQMTIADYRQQLGRTVPESVDIELVGRLVELFVERRILPFLEAPDLLGLSMESPHDMEKLKSSVGFLKSVGLVESSIFDWRWKGGPKHKRPSIEARRSKPARVRHRLPR
jgi:hypothetical protein